METTNTENRAPIFAISRLRMGIDGPGVTTLVTFMGCPLRCKYCINDRCHEPVFEADGVTPREGIMLLTPQELYDRVKIDNIYFQATGGGICFGGGEPGLYANFIREFREICDPTWKITIETSLNFDTNLLRFNFHAIDYWIVDIKTFNGKKYKEYTDCYIQNVMVNLSWLQDFVDKDKILVKLPLIPNYTDDIDVEYEQKTLLKQGFKHIKVVKYIQRPSRFTTQNSENHEQR
jgi:pyruvate formate lyase activating enzyme